MQQLFADVEARLINRIVMARIRKLDLWVEEAGYYNIAPIGLTFNTIIFSANREFLTEPCPSGARYLYKESNKIQSPIGAKY